MLLQEFGMCTCLRLSRYKYKVEQLKLSQHCIICKVDSYCNADQLDQSISQLYSAVNVIIHLQCNTAMQFSSVTVA